MSAKIAKALHEVMMAVGYVQKTKKSPIGYKYAGEAAVLEALRPAMVEAGLLLLPCVTKLSDVDAYGNTHVIVEYTLAHKDGDIWPHKLAMAGSGNDKNKAGVSDKGVYKAITGANKYLLFKLFQIETGDDPERDEIPEQRGHDAVPDLSPAATKIMSSIDQCDTVRALDNYGGGIAADVAQFPEAEATLIRTRFAQRKRTLKQSEAQQGEGT